MNLFKSTDDPLAKFEAWYHEAVNAKIAQPDAMALATVGADGKPAVRMVLYKGISEGGVRFFTNYTSRKALQIEENPFAAVVFHWVLLDRQVRFEGRVEKLSKEESREYFEGRPRLSQIGAWASEQSAVLGSREEFEARVQAVEKKFDGKDIPCPEFWGGYRLIPDTLEFWIGRGNRLHERYCYRRGKKGWEFALLSP